MKAGDLVKYTWYGLKGETDHYGLFLRKVSQQDISLHKDWGDIWVLTKDGEERWVSWQCEVINEDK